MAVMLIVASKVRMQLGYLLLELLGHNALCILL